MGGEIRRGCRHDLQPPFTLDFTTTADTFRDAMNFMPRPTYWVGIVEGAALNVHCDGEFQTFRSLMTIADGEVDAVGAMVQEKSKLMKSDDSAN